MSFRRNEYSDRNGGRSVIQARRDQVEWMRCWDWRFWVTLTFSWDVSRSKAAFTLNEYFNKLETIYRDSVSCVIAQEQKTISGSGKPAGRVHFHLLMGSSVSLTATSISSL